MARSMVFTCGLPLIFWGDAVQYAVVILNRAPTNSSPGRASPMKRPEEAELRALCTARHARGNRQRYKRLQCLPAKGKVVVTTQHAKNIETLDKKQNENVQKLYLEDDTPEADSKRGTPPASGEKDTRVGTAIGRAKRRGKKMK
ncbi:hypothetical protein PC128_g10587 [Phytophthora cactorum]|nr:hypothetical protein PC128_g10587 [Phytophthora cactorum]KAG4056407.1 hypothetical protein PC123_g8556 [Phytophthora cactorum]